MSTHQAARNRAALLPCGTPDAEAANCMTCPPGTAARTFGLFRRRSVTPFPQTALLQRDIACYNVQLNTGRRVTSVFIMVDMGGGGRCCEMTMRGVK